DLPHLERREIEGRDATHVERRNRLALRAGAFAEGSAAADLAEAMPDRMLVGGVGREIRLRRREAQLLARHEMQQITLARAVTAVAVDDGADFRFGLEGDPAAMTTT